MITKNRSSIPFVRLHRLRILQITSHLLSCSSTLSFLYFDISSQLKMMWSRLFLVTCLALASISSRCSAQQAGDDYGGGGGGGGGDYYDQGAGAGADDYAQDNLYHDYALRQQEKAIGGAAGGVEAGGLLGGWGKLVATGALGWMLGGKFHTRRQKHKLDNKFKQEQKALYQQYYEDVYTLQLQNAELVQALEQMGVRLKKS